MNYIKKTKDLKIVNIEKNIDEDSEYPFMCPLSKIEFNGMNRFVCLWSCGCFFIERSLKESKEKKCPICNKAFSKDDIISMNLTPEEQNLKR